MQRFMMNLLICSITMSGLALFYMAITPLLEKRYSQAGRYYAWLVIVIGLIIPFRPQFGNALFHIDMGDNSAGPVIRAGYRPPVIFPADNPLPAAIPELSWPQIAAAIWLSGMLLFLAFQAVRHYRFLKLTARWSENVTDERTLALFQDLNTQMGISRKTGLQVCNCIGSPMMIGFFSPRILLPAVDFTEDELHLILKHELVHYRRKDLWYKCLVLTAAAIHWFNPFVCLISKMIDNICELSCDEEVVRRLDADTRLSYCETIIGVVRYKSQLKTAFSTNFYGGKKGMKKRIFSIMDRSRKKAGVAVLCGVLMLTMGTGMAFAANAETQSLPELISEEIVTATSFVPNPDIYAPYAAFGITISEDGRLLLYQGQPVRLFVDEKADGQAFYLDEAGAVNLSVIRNAAGGITGIERISAQKAREYYENFLAEEPDGNYLSNSEAQAAQDKSNELSKFDQYQQFGISYSEADEVLFYNGQRVKFFCDRYADGLFETFWTDDEGTVNLAALRDASGQITGIESISDRKALEYQTEAYDRAQNSLDGLEERVEKKAEEKMKAIDSRR